MDAMGVGGEVDDGSNVYTETLTDEEPALMDKMTSGIVAWAWELRPTTQ